MGQGGSTEQDAKVKAVVGKLSKMEIKDIEALFMELSTKTQEGESVIRQPTWLNRDKFAEVFGMTELVIEQLFEAFDRDKNGLVDMEEFVTGMALCLHGSVKEKCKLLFKIFNLDGDDGISKEELSAVLTSCLQSAQAVLLSTLKSEGISGCEETVANQTGTAMMVSVVVDKIVKDAFEKCDLSGTGKLEINEFVKWVHKNPKLMNNIFVMQCPKPSSQSNSLPTSASSFSIIETPVTEEESDVFESIKPIPEQEEPELKQIEEETTQKPQTLLNIASTTSSKQQSLQDFFSQQTGKDDQQNFFDSLGADTSTQSNQQLDNIGKENSLPRPLSETCLTQNLDGSLDAHGGSENNLNQIIPRSQLIPQNVKSESLQSITLSQDSLLDDKNNSSEFSQNSVPPKSSVNDVVVSLEPNLDPAPEIFPSDVQYTNNASHSLQDASHLEATQGSTDSVVSNAVSQYPDSAVLENTGQSESAPPSKSAEQSSQDIPELAVDIVKVERQRSVPMAEAPAEMFAEEKPYCSYWQPNYRTQQTLNLFGQGQLFDQSLLTFPSVLVENQMGDPVRDLVAKYLGEQEAYKRPTLTSEAVEMNENGIRKLLSAGCWRAAVDLTTKYLTAYGQGVSSTKAQERTLLTPKLLQIWFVRISLLIKLRMFSSAEAELVAFKDFEGPDMYYQFYPQLYPGRKGSIVSFSFRLLHAELPQYNGRPNVALDRLYLLLSKVTRVVSNLSNGLNEDGEKNVDIPHAELEERLKLWKKRQLQIHYSLGNCLLGMKEYTLAVKLFEEVIKLDPARKLPILSAIGRIYLQFGDFETATKYFKMVEKAEEKDEKILSIIAMNKGYLSLAHSSYEEAYQQFTLSSQHNPENLAANNNAAVCLLFIGKVKGASNVLESMVCRSPQVSLHEDILFNLNTVYELETSRALQKKHKLLDLVSKHRGDRFNVQSLKLT
ncbi:trafficking protein particle complex subunit 12-like [Hydractinia symbiolongicarpus]|uniref:trafficking protein particle complex subunit 12-like n=1 Tax=Hydractinia symbiolongicarpus TaxID=13093 RepID=UPI002550C36E|nr:trafficking protein particle complex subunit 12-like [Hydractinia symbiolongicarpus]